MSIGPFRMARRWAALWYAAVALYATPLAAQVVVPGVYTTAITVQGEPLGMEFADWAASGIPVVDMDPADNPGDSFVDLADLQIANDASYLYLHMTMHNDPTSLGNLYLAFDTDQDLATGFDVFSAGLIGSDFAYQTDFPFQQATGVFNTGAMILGETALIFPFWTEAGPPFGNEIEWRIPLSVAIAPSPGTPAFPNDSFDMMVYTTDGLSDVSQVISYTLAEAPMTPGDFDNDSDIDGQDFLLWQRGLGGMFTANDLADWRANFGATTVAAIGAVPEPAALSIASIGGAILLAGRARVRARLG